MVRDSKGGGYIKVGGRAVATEGNFTWAFGIFAPHDPAIVHLGLPLLRQIGLIFAFPLFRSKLHDLACLHALLSSRVLLLLCVKGNGRFK